MFLVLISFGAINYIFSYRNQIVNYFVFCSNYYEMLSFIFAIYAIEIAIHPLIRLLNCFQT